jgi:hypothetical protein
LEESLRFNSSLKNQKFDLERYDAIMTSARYAGDTWVCIKSLPRVIAESWRRDLENEGIESVLRTPYGWVERSNVLEIETGMYQGDVDLFVPEIKLELALELLDLSIQES